MRNIKNEIEIAIQQHHKGNLDEAEKIYKKIYQMNSKDAPCCYLLGTLYAQQKRFDLSIDFLKKSIEIDNSNPDAFYNLANVYQNKNNFQKAIENYNATINIKKNYLKAYLNLGHIFFRLSNYKKSIESYLEILKIDNNYTDALNNLGTVYAELENYDKAIDYLNQAIGSNKENYRAYYNLGTIYQNKNEYLKAIENFKKSIDLKSFYPSAYNNLGFVYKKLDNFTEAKKFYEISIKQDPKYTLAKLNYGNLLDMMCEHSLAIKEYHKAIKINPNMLSARWAALNTFPFVYKEEKEIEQYKENFEIEISAIEKFINQTTNLDKEEITKGLLNSTNFYLHYQGINNFNLQKRYAKIIEKLTRNTYSVDIKSNKSKKIKVGFVSPCFIEHSVTNTHKNFYLKINRENFDVYIYHINDEKDKYTEFVKKNVFSFSHLTNIEKIIKKIGEDSLDILFFVDIGMDPKMQILGSLRFAPIQINGNAQPITSGFKNIDYVISSELMEPKNGQDHYTEKLIQLPNTGQCYEEPVLENKETKLKKEKKIFFNLQNLFKLLPDEDQIYVDLIKNIKDCEIWFMQARNSISTELFISRIKQKLETNGLNYEKYIKFKKRRSQKDFFDLISQCHVVIDSINWSGNNTSHQAISLNKPIITLPGKFMRSRHTYAILKQINTNETIAKNRKDYVEIAKKLSTEDNFMTKIVNKINKNKKLLFNDQKPIKELEKVLINLVK